MGCTSPATGAKSACAAGEAAGAFGALAGAASSLLVIGAAGEASGSTSGAVWR